MTLLVDTNLAPAGDEARYWRQAVERLFGARVRLDAPAASPLDARLAIHRVERVSLLELSGDPMTLAQDPDAARSTVTALALLDGSMVLAQAERECAIAAGEVCLYLDDAPFELVFSTRVHVVAVSVPAAEFLDLFPRGREALRTPITGDQGAAALFVDQARTLLRRRNALEAPTATALANSIVHLVGAVACSAVVDHPDGSHRTREKLERVLSFARAHLRDPDLDVETIAHAVHLSVRQVHRLFSSEPMSLMQWVMTQRLQNCHRELVQAGSSGRSIGRIAYELSTSVEI